MNIGEKLKTARQQSHLTQEGVADLILVSRQTISNWENEKSYPDIVNLIKLSDLYQISLDTLLKDDGKMIEHLDKTTNAVKSNQKLQTFLLSYLAMITCLLLLSLFFLKSYYFLLFLSIIMILGVLILFYQIIKRI
ncbi:helix-turn-helix domain-containing protein [Streptococcus mutans]|uniref:helix-turn-helix domain-containing protein n=1 Tax=Streptococcus mutans TaxID=1309 RepID=UPI0002B5A381|nr:helix-turn-helix transcriptional regulator [Streptococcus mutans]EMB72018.1 putative transcriptional regulator [Streptococcus mutans 15VF2]MCB5152897.1 helix-turn-helix domain-containing protein [Streptococcus mutans]